jgi:hypothetical protein
MPLDNQRLLNLMQRLQAGYVQAEGSGATDLVARYADMMERVNRLVEKGPVTAQSPQMPVDAGNTQNPSFPPLGRVMVTGEPQAQTPNLDILMQQKPQGAPMATSSEPVIPKPASPALSELSPQDFESILKVANSPSAVPGVRPMSSLSNEEYMSLAKTAGATSRPLPPPVEGYDYTVSDSTKASVPASISGWVNPVMTAREPEPSILSKMLAVGDHAIPADESMLNSVEPAAVANPPTKATRVPFLDRKFSPEEEKAYFGKEEFVGPPPSAGSNAAPSDQSGGGEAPIPFTQPAAQAGGTDDGWGWKDFLGLLAGGRNYLNYKMRSDEAKASRADNKSYREALLADRKMSSEADRALKEQDLAIQYARDLSKEGQFEEKEYGSDRRNMVRALTQPMASDKNEYVKSEMERLRAREAALRDRRIGSTETKKAK